MLVLARKAHETIRIGDHISISIVSIRGRVVRVGIEAPAEIRVARGELTQTHGDPTANDTSPSPPLAEDVSECRATPRLSAEAFMPPPRLSTQHINRVLSLRRRPKAAEPPVIQPVLAWL